MDKDEKLSRRLGRDSDPDKASEPMNFFENLDAVKEEFAGKDILVFLDYDGTLTPIVATPDLAVISEEMRGTVENLARTCQVSIVSGRTTDDVKGKVNIEGIFYAGSHGFEIVAPDGHVEINKQARDIKPVIDDVYRILSKKLADVKGALVEHVKYTISAHYRLVSEEDLPKVERAVFEILGHYSMLRKTDGKKVFEIRPKVDWHKGKAVEWILKILNYNQSKNIVVYIGDDRTDEDAFQAVESKGVGILVSDPSRPSEAKYCIKNTDQVKEVLEILIDLKN